MNVYIDESGDLGFNFQKPYRNGGSSRYLTIAFLLVPKQLTHLTKRIVTDLYSRRKKLSSKELKGCDLTIPEKLHFAEKVIALLNQNPQIEIVAITVNKENVRDHIRRDPNKLYNYMIGLVLPRRIKDKSAVTIIPDERSIKVESGNSLVEYLQIKLSFEFDAATVIQWNPPESHKTLNLQFVDCVSHIVWSRYEDHEFKIFNALKEKIGVIPLFF